MGKHAALAFLAALLRGAAMADFAAIEIAAGGEWRVDSACRLAAVRAVSSVSSGTVALSGVSELDVTSNAVETVTDTSVVWTRVLTNGAEAVTNSYPGMVAYTPPPPWLLASEGWTTNTSTRTVSRQVKTGETLALTNSIASVTCSGGLARASPTNCWLLAGERVVSSGTAKGTVTLILER